MMQTTETGAGTTTGGGAAAVPAATNSEETIGPFVYIDGRLAEVRFYDGYCTIDSSGRANYHYYMRDYMGSVCVVTDDEGNIEQQNAYYAWGGIYSAMSVTPALQDRKYSGKPFDRRHGLDLPSTAGTAWTSTTTAREGTTPHSPDGHPPTRSANTTTTFRRTHSAMIIL